MRKRTLSAALAVVVALSLMPMPMGAAITPMAQALINVAEAELATGYSVLDIEGATTKYGEWAHNPTGGWCGFFVSWCAHQAGIPNDIVISSDLDENRGYPPWMIERAPQYQGRFVRYTGADSMKNVQPGDILFVDSEYNGTCGHVGIVTSVDKSVGTVTSIEGNMRTGGRSYVMKRVRYFDNSNDHRWGLFYGYVHPNYDNTIPVHPHNKGEYVFQEDAHPHCNCYRCSICGEIWKDTDSKNYWSTCEVCQTHTCDKGEYMFQEDAHPHCSCYKCSLCGKIWKDTSSKNYWSTCETCKNHTHDKGEYVFQEDAHPHCSCYRCSFCGEIWKDTSSSNYWSTCSICNPHTHDKGEYLFQEDAHPHCSCYRCSVCGEIWKDTSSKNYWSTCEICKNHTHDKGEYMFQEDAHPHCSCYKCSLCGEIWKDTSSKNYWSTCETCKNHTHDKGEYLFQEDAHPHCNCYKCSLCGEIWKDTSSSNYWETCSICTGPYTIGPLIVRDTGGIELMAIPAGSFLVTVPITNQTASGDAVVLLASYTTAGQYRGLMYVAIKNATEGATVEVTLPVDNAAVDIAKLKAFAIPSFGDPTPLGPASVFPAAE